MQTSVALILFNRPDTTERVMREIARARPPKLFLIADGPRPDWPEDSAKCAATRAAAERLLDWDCELSRNYSDTNLGCGRRPITGIDWVFEHTEQAIILEDDCVPHPTFFPFCEGLLQKYRNDERVIQIAGNNLQFGGRHGKDSYFFSRHNVCAGGWATWRRGWKHYDFAMKSWPALRGSPWLTYTVNNKLAAEFWRARFDEAYEGGPQVDYWDYQWTFACWTQNGLTAIPNVQLLSNIGFREDGTHTKWAGDRWAKLPTEAMTFPLRHPKGMHPDADADRFLAEQVAALQPRKRALRQILSRVTPQIRRAISYLRLAHCGSP